MEKRKHYIKVENPKYNITAPKCPYCGEIFVSMWGLNIHIGQMHKGKKVL
jgi:ribosomal protein S27AE